MKIPTRLVALALTLLSIGGVGATGWISVKCHEKAKTKATKKDKVLSYLPAVISFAGTSACIIGSHHLSRKEIAALTGTCTYLAANRDKIVQLATKKLGANDTKDIVKQAEQETSTATEHYEATGNGVELFMDAYSGRMFYSDRKNVLNGERKLNEDYKSGLYVCLNDLYSYWGLRQTEFGQENGWPSRDDFQEDAVYEPYDELVFDHVEVEHNGQKMTMIFILSEPMQDWMEV